MAMFNINPRQPVAYYLAGAAILLTVAVAGWRYFAAAGAGHQTPCDLLYRQLSEAANSAQTVSPNQLVSACEAASRKFPEAPRYAYFYGKALSVLNRYERAIEHFTRAARADYAPAQYELGIVHLYGRGVSYNPATARHWLQTAAQNVYAPAQYRLGEMYLIGEGGDRDIGQAIHWLTQAAEQDFTEAQYSLAMTYRTHPELDNYREHALHWLREAAERDNASAQYVLANEYLRGEIVSQDYAQATDWMQQAADNGYGAAEKGFFSSGFCSEVSATLR